MSGYNPLYDENTAQNEGKKKKEPRKRSARTNTIIALVLVVLLAGVTFFATRDTDAKVYVFKTTEPVSALQRINANSLEIVEVPSSFVEGGTPTSAEIAADQNRSVADRTAFARRAFVGSSPDRLRALQEQYLANAFAQTEIPAGVQLRGDMLTFDSLVSNLGPTERLVSIQASVGASVSGVLRAGDRVDVIASSSSGQTAELVLQDVEIVSVAVDESLYASAAQQQLSTTSENNNLSPEQILPGDPIPGTYTLRVQAADSTRLAVYDANSKMYLAYRAASAINSNVPQASLAQ